jgi:hypothetical protein
MDRTGKPQQNWLPGLGPSIDEINRDLASIPVSYHSVDLSGLEPSRESQGGVKRPDPSEAKMFLQGTFYVELVSPKHPECSAITSEARRVAKLTELILEDPEKVLREFASVLNHRGMFALAVVKAVTTIGNQNLTDEQQWQAFNDKLRVFMGIVGPPTSNSLSKEEYTRLTDLGFQNPKTAKVLADSIRDYLFLIEDGR